MKPNPTPKAIEKDLDVPNEIIEFLLVSNARQKVEFISFIAESMVKEIKDSRKAGKLEVLRELLDKLENSTSFDGGAIWDNTQDRWQSLSTPYFGDHIKDLVRDKIEELEG